MTDYPWERCRPGEMFFVPALDVERVEVEGLRLGHVITAVQCSARVVVYKGMLGVMFRRGRWPKRVGKRA